MKFLILLLSLNLIASPGKETQKEIGDYRQAISALGTGFGHSSVSGFIFFLPIFFVLSSVFR